MKILQIIPSLEIGGAEIMLETLSNELAKKNEVIIVSLKSTRTIISERLKQNNIKIIFLNKKKGLDFSIYKKIYDIVIVEKPDVVHTHLHVDKYVMPVAIFTGIKKRVHTFHSIAQKESNFLDRIINLFFYRFFHLIPVALSKEVMRTIMNVYKISESKIPVIYNGIDLSKFTVKSTYDIHDDFKIVHVGRFAKVKNHAMLVKAFSKFHNTHKDSQLFLIGDGETFDEIKFLVSDLQLDDSVFFLGLQGDVSKYLKKADLFILPSLYEGIPMSLIEAMSCGLPIIASAVGGIPDMLDNSKSALLIDPSVDTIYNSINNIYNDESLRISLGKNAYKKSKSFSSKMMAKKYMEVYTNEK